MIDEQARGWIKDALIYHWGDRCIDHDSACATCAVWSEYDRLIAGNPGIEESRKAIDLIDTICLEFTANGLTEGFHEWATGMAADTVIAAQTAERERLFELYRRDPEQFAVVASEVRD